MTLCDIASSHRILWHCQSCLSCKNLKHLEVEWLRFAIEIPLRTFVHDLCEPELLLPLVFIHVPGVVVGYSFFAGDFPRNRWERDPIA